MHPLLAEDFVQTVIDERIATARRVRDGTRRRPVRAAVGRMLVSLGTRLSA